MAMPAKSPKMTSVNPANGRIIRSGVRSRPQMVHKTIKDSRLIRFMVIRRCDSFWTSIYCFEEKYAPAVIGSQIQSWKIINLVMIVFILPIIIP